MEAVDSDVMAFVTNTCTIVMVQNTDGSESVNYILKDNGRVPIRGDSIEGYELYEIYDYPVATEDGLVNCYGRGALVTNLVAAAGTTNRVVAVSSGMVALVHAQVYEEFGFNPKTANPTAYEDETAVNTKQFTALDKYLLIRYFAALGSSRDCGRPISRAKIILAAHHSSRPRHDAPLHITWREVAVDADL